MLVCCDNNFLALPHLNRYPTSLTEDFSHSLTESSRSKLIEAQSKVPQRRTGGFAAGVAAYHAAALFPATLALDLVGGHHGVAHSQAAGRQLLPQSAGTAAAQRESPAVVIQQAYVEGVSTRRVDDLIKALGCDGISSSQVSRICEQLDEVVESFLGRPLDGGPYPYVWLDGLTRRFGRAVASSTSAWWWRRGSMPKGSVRSWVWTWAPARTAPSGWPSCGR